MPCFQVVRHSNFFFYPCNKGGYHGNGRSSGGPAPQPPLPRYARCLCVRSMQYRIADPWLERITTGNRRLVPVIRRTLRLRVRMATPRSLNRWLLRPRRRQKNERDEHTERLGCNQTNTGAPMRLQEIAGTDVLSQIKSCVHCVKSRHICRVFNLFLRAIFFHKEYLHPERCCRRFTARPIMQGQCRLLVRDLGLMGFPPEVQAMRP